MLRGGPGIDVPLLTQIEKSAAVQVCVPIDPELADEFDPVDGVPTVSQLLSELADPGHAVVDAQVLLRSGLPLMFQKQIVWA